MDPPGWKLVVNVIDCSFFQKLSVFPVFIQLLYYKALFATYDGPASMSRGFSALCSPTCCIRTNQKPQLTAHEKTIVG